MTAPITLKRFGPTSGFAPGVIGLVLCGGVALVALTGEVTESSVQVALGAAVGAVLLWAYMLRPRVILDEVSASVLLRNSFVDWRIPVAAVKVVGVRAVTTIKTDDARFECAAVGYPVRKIIRGAVSEGPDVPLASAPLTAGGIQELMIDQILAAADRAREQGLPAGTPQRLPAWPEIVGLAVAVSAFVVGLLV